MHPHDHRQLGQRLDLFHMEDDAPGMAYWHPRGFAVYRLLEEAVRREMSRQGLREVRSPQVMRRAVWEASGHWSHFAEHMFRIQDQREAALKPVSCPGHLHIARHGQLSYRDLPYRVGELGMVHRDEQSGALHGLFRLRQFCQDDGHILCAPEHVAGEVRAFLGRIAVFYAAFELDVVAVAFSSRPAGRVGSDAAWDRAEDWLRSAGEESGLALVDKPGEGAFYGPKLEVLVRDRLGREWQCGTIQLDLHMPEAFDVSYIDRDGSRSRPILLHRALLGSLERFLAIVLESHGGLPAWLAPDQVVVLPVAAAQVDYAEGVVSHLEGAGLRVRLDRPSERLGKRIRAAHAAGVPFAAVVGPREVDRREVAVRGPGGQDVVRLLEAGAVVADQCAPPI